MEVRVVPYFSGSDLSYSGFRYEVITAVNDILRSIAMKFRESPKFLMNITPPSSGRLLSLAVNQQKQEVS
jgi:hypothetical protein